MLNTFAKLLLVSTSLAPIHGAVAVNQFARDEPWTRWVWWLIAALELFCGATTEMLYETNSKRESDS